MKGGPGASGRVLPPLTGRSRVQVAVSSHCTGEGKACHLHPSPDPAQSGSSLHWVRPMKKKAWVLVHCRSTIIYYHQRKTKPKIYAALLFPAHSTIQHDLINDSCITLHITSTSPPLLCAGFYVICSLYPTLKSSCTITKLKIFIVDNTIEKHTACP